MYLRHLLLRLVLYHLYLGIFPDNRDRLDLCTGQMDQCLLDLLLRLDIHRQPRLGSPLMQILSPILGAIFELDQLPLIRLPFLRELPP